MSKGTVIWFNRDIGTGFIRTVAGANVLFLDSDLQESDLKLIREGTRVSLDILISPSGLAATNVRNAELPEGHSDHYTYDFTGNVFRTY